MATQDLPRSAAHPFYVRLNQILEQRDFDAYVEGERFYAGDGRPGLPPGRYFRLLLIGRPGEGKTVGIDATTLEANAALRSIVRRDTGESYQDFLMQLAQASGIETPTRSDLARIDRKRKKKGSNDDWTHPHDPDAKITKMKDGRVGTPRGLQGRLIAIMTAILPLVREVSEVLTGRERSVRRASPTERRASTESAVVPIAAREMAFTTGC